MTGFLYTTGNDSMSEEDEVQRLKWNKVYKVDKSKYEMAVWNSVLNAIILEEMRSENRPTYSKYRANKGHNE